MVKRNKIKFDYGLKALAILLILGFPLMILVDFLITFPLGLGSYEWRFVDIITSSIVSLIGVILGVLLIKRYSKTISLIKEYFFILIFLLALFGLIPLVFYELPNYEQLGYTLPNLIYLITSMFVMIIILIIFIIYLNLSKHVKKIFRKTKVSYGRLFGIPLFLILLIGVSYALFFVIQGQPQIEGSEEVNFSYVLQGFFSDYIPLGELSEKGTIQLTINSSLPIQIEVLESEEDYDKLFEGQQYNKYAGCSVMDKKQAVINCNNFIKGGIAIINNNLESLKYNITIKKYN